MTRRIISILAAACCCALPLRAQFSLYGTEAPSVSWNTFSTDHYRFVYPAGCDSLAFEYAREWEMARGPLEGTIGYAPNSRFRKPMPVILHPYMAYSNGMVVWAPRRMEMYTGPEMYSPGALPWQRLLSIHEGRHVSQQQFLRDALFGVLYCVAGEMSAGLSDLLCYDTAMFEGDAVATETALSEAGRGRCADFLEYYRVCCDEGEDRDYWQWRYGSLDRFTPDYYKIGYLMQAGIRSDLNAPNFMADTYRRLFTKGAKGRLDNFNRTVEESTSLTFPEAYEAIMDAFGKRWTEDLEARAPFQPKERLTRPGTFFEEYSNLVPSPEGIFATRSGLARATTLVRLDKGRAKTIRPFSSETSPLQYSPVSGRIYWTEFTPDIRYEHHSSSVLKWMTPGDPRQHVLAGDGRRAERHRYFNPAPNSLDSLVAVAETLPDGASRVVVLSEADGEAVETYPAPDGILALEPVWLEDILYVVGQSLDGIGIYRASNFRCVLKPSMAKINHIREYDGRLYFTSDRNGENELYSLDPYSGKVVQETNLPRGGKDFSFKGDSLYFTALKPNGRMIYRSSQDDLPSEIVKFGLNHIYPEADDLSDSEPEWLDERFDIDEPEPQKYSQAKHLMKIHSWLPAWADYDELAELSFESLTTDLAPGATVFFHNDLNTFAGYAGYSYSPVDSLGWGGGAHINLGYYGALPVVKASLDFDRSCVRGTVSSYIPLNFSGGGWQRGVIPNATFSFAGPKYGYMVGVRAYTMRPVPSSCIYPRLGVGLEAGVANNKAYGLLYAYLPGVLRTHGLFASAQHIGHSGQTTVRVKYALPFASVDWHWKDFIYVRNFELYPQYSFVRTAIPSGSMRVNSFGLGADAVLGNLWVIRTAIRLGIQYNYSTGLPGSPHQVSAIFSVDI